MSSRSSVAAWPRHIEDERGDFQRTIASNGRGGEEVTSRDLSYDTTSLKGGLSQSLHVQCIHIIKESMAASGPARTFYIQSTHELWSMHLILLYKSFPSTKHWGTTFTFCTKNNHI